MVSAFWHGFYPLYYVAFFMLALIIELYKDVSKSLILFENFPFSYIFGNLAIISIFNYFGTVFALMTLERGYYFFAGTSYYAFIVLIGSLAFTKYFNIVEMAKRAEKKREA